MSTKINQNAETATTVTKSGIIFDASTLTNNQVLTSSDETGFAADPQGTKEALNLTPNFGSERLV